MKQIHLGLALLLILGLTPALAAREAQDERQYKSKAEQDALNALYAETEPRPKAALGESFLLDFPDSDMLPLAYMNLLSAYEQDRDWAHVLDAASRFVASGDSDTQARAFIYPRGLMAAQMQNDVARIIEFGNLTLEADPNSLGAMLTLASVYMDHLPTTQPGRDQALASAYDLANRARVQAQQYFGGETSPEKTQVDITIHTTLGQVHYARRDYQRAADEYLRVIDLAPRNGDAYYRLGDSYQYLAASASDAVEEALAALTEAQEQGQSEATITDLQARYDALQANVLAYLDRSIDFFATAAVIGGTVGPDATLRLEGLYRNRNGDSLEGLEELLDEKRAAIRDL